MSVLCRCHDNVNALRLTYAPHVCAGAGPCYPSSFTTFWPSAVAPFPAPAVTFSVDFLHGDYQRYWWTLRFPERETLADLQYFLPLDEDVRHHRLEYNADGALTLRLSNLHYGSQGNGSDSSGPTQPFDLFVAHRSVGARLGLFVDPAQMVGPVLALFVVAFALGTATGQPTAGKTAKPPPPSAATRCCARFVVYADIVVHLVILLLPSSLWLLALPWLLWLAHVLSELRRGGPHARVILSRAHRFYSLLSLVLCVLSAPVLAYLLFLSAFPVGAGGRSLPLPLPLLSARTSLRVQLLLVPVVAALLVVKAAVHLAAGCGGARLGRSFEHEAQE